MKAHSEIFKTNIKRYGRQINSEITFEGIKLSKKDLNKVAPSFQTSLLKSVMKQLIVDSNIQIPKKTIINYKFGVKNNTEYENLNFGNYIVKDIIEQKDTKSYKITCCDKMLNTMKDYVDIGVEYPISVREYTNALCEFLGLTFKNKNDTFVNYNKIIAKELYLDENGNSLGYTFRDVFDELSQVTASNICIDDNDEAEIRYINDTSDTIDENFFKDNNVNIGEKYGPINSVVLSRSGGSDSIYMNDEQSIAQNGLCELRIEDNQIMNFNDRNEYLEEIFNKLNGLEFYTNDFQSTGICYYEVCDKYNVSIDGNAYPCIMFNDEIKITKGLEETIFTKKPKITETEYKHTSTEDKKISKVYIIAKKNEGKIESVVSTVNNVSTKVDNNYQEMIKKFGDVATKSDVITIEQSVTQLQTDTYTKTEINTKLTDGSVTKVHTTSGTFDENGMHYEKTNAPTSSTINETGVSVQNSNSREELLFAGYDNELRQTIVRTENLNVRKYLNVGKNSRIEDYEDGGGIFIV